MKKWILLFVCLVFGSLITTVHSQSVIVTDDASYTTPASGAILDVKSTSSGFLPPRVSLTSISDVTTIPSPTAGLIVYNTNVLITNGTGAGHYYWDGSTWARLLGSGQPQVLSTIAVSANTTLSPSNNIVLGSGDITLTLPTVTSAENGLQISVKNTGTYTDLVTVQGNGGATIDNVASTTLTRWKGKTFVASGGNWIIKDGKHDDGITLEVSPAGSWTTIPEVLAFLNAHMTDPMVVILKGGIYSIAATQTINLPHPVTFQGASYGETIIETTSGLGSNPAFVCETECYFKMLAIDGTQGGSDGLVLNGIGQYYEVKDVYIEGFARGIALTGNSELWVFETDFNGASGAGLEISASGAATFKISESDFISCAKGINLASSSGATVSIINCTFYCGTGTDIAVKYIPASFTNFTSMFITNNAWNNIGTFFSGFDFSLASGRDAKAYIQNNAGSEDKTPHCKMNVLNGATTTTITTANTWYKAQWTNTSSYTCKWTIDNNKMTYQPTNTRDVWVIISGNLSCNNSSRTISFGIVKNGVTTARYGESTLRIGSSSSNQPFQFSTVVYLSDVTANDYFELYCTSANSGDIITFQDINWFAQGQ